MKMSGLNRSDRWTDYRKHRTMWKFVEKQASESFESIHAIQICFLYETSSAFGPKYLKVRDFYVFPDFSLCTGAQHKIVSYPTCGYFG